jgi:hypothetical protein
MRDTPQDITQKMCEMIQAKSPAERCKMGCSMYETSRYLIIRAILRDNPHISKEALRQALFLKFYGNDFDLKTRKKILQHLKR